MKNSRFEDYKRIPKYLPIEGSFLDPESVGYVYVIGFEEAEVVKIGSATSPGLRLDQLQCGCPFELKMLALVSIYTRSQFEVETAAHKLAADFRIRGEWFDLSVDEALSAILKAARNIKAKVAATSVVIEAQDEMERKAKEQEDEERRAILRRKLGME